MRESVELCLTRDAPRLSAGRWTLTYLLDCLNSDMNIVPLGLKVSRPHQPSNAEIPKYKLVRPVTWERGSTSDGALPAFELNLSSNFGHKCHFNDDRPHWNTLKSIVAFRVDTAEYILGKGRQVNENLGNMWILVMILAFFVTFPRDQTQSIVSEPK